MLHFSHSSVLNFALRDLRLLLVKMANSKIVSIIAVYTAITWWQITGKLLKYRYNLACVVLYRSKLITTKRNETMVVYMLILQHFSLTYI